MNIIKANYQTTDRPRDIILGYEELSKATGWTIGGIKTRATRLPFKRWRCSGVIVFDRAEVSAWVAAQNT